MPRAAPVASDRLRGGVVGTDGGRGRIMSRVPGWLGRLGAGLTEMSERLNERRAAAERESDELPADRPSAGPAAGDVPMSKGTAPRRPERAPVSLGARQIKLRRRLRQLPVHELRR